MTDNIEIKHKDLPKIDKEDKLVNSSLNLSASSSLKGDAFFDIDYLQRFHASGWLCISFT
jgi:hypothetical protein